jgi:hypothetical protein
MTGEASSMGVENARIPASKPGTKTRRARGLRGAFVFDDAEAWDFAIGFIGDTIGELFLFRFQRN